MSHYKSAPRGSWILLALVAAAMALLVIDLPYSTRNWRLLINALHAPAFAVLAIAHLRWALGFLSRTKAVFLTATVCTLIGLTSEILQMWGPRDADHVDLMNDALGIATGICLTWAFTMEPESRRKTKSLPVLLLLLPLLGLTLTPAAWYGYAVMAQQWAMPKLLSFENHWETTLYEASYDARLDLDYAPDKWPIESSRIVKIVATGRNYPGIKIQPTANWQNYRVLSFYAASANNTSVNLTISIYDDDIDRDYENRFNRSYLLSRAPQLIRIPLDDVKSAPRDRNMNMGAIKEIIIFIGNANGSEVLFLDEFQLHP